jgi:serine/threonine protein phosphatase PrpC
MLRFPADDPLEVARELTDFARTSGGEDNITVVVAFV